MKSAKITVTTTQGSSCPQLAVVNKDNDAHVTVTKGTKITVPEKVRLTFEYEGGSLDGFKFAQTEKGLAQAKAVGQKIGVSTVDEPFTVKRQSTSTTNVTDTDKKGTWHFQMCLDGTWVDPQIYNKGTG